MARRGVQQDRVVDVLGWLPGLADALPGERLSAARRMLRARSLLVRRGRWAAAADAELVAGGPGFLVLEGALMRCVTAMHRTAGELLGPGDLLQPAYDIAAEPPFATYWRAIEDTRLALLDARFAHAAVHVPEVTPALVASVTRRTGEVSHQLVIVQSQSVEARILTLLRHLADRWGVVTPDGLVLPSFLTHGTLSLLLGARRPGVTSAMVRLRARGLVERRDDGRLVLAADADGAGVGAAAGATVAA